MQKKGIGKKILVVDDIKDSRGLVKKILELRGYEVIEAGTGEDAINIVQTELPDLILMDIRMPGIDGKEATRRIRALPKVAHIPILAMTASVKPKDKQSTIEAGCDDFIRKPIDIEQLPKQVAEHIDRAASLD